MSVTLAVRAPSTRVSTEKAFPLTISLYELLGRIERLTGIPPNAQKLTLYSSGAEGSGSVPVGDSCGFGDDAQVLLLWNAASGMTIQVDDKNPARSAWLGEEVEKFELSDADYERRSDSLRSFLQANQLGRYAPEAQKAPESPNYMEIPVGSRCSVGGTDFPRRGTVRFVGNTDFARGIWVGVEYDEPVGKNDGSVAGSRYFTTRPSYGGFVKPELVQVGDFPELDIDEV